MVGFWGNLVDQVAFVNYNPWENSYKQVVNEITTPCSDLWRRMFVWWDGTVNPCDVDYKSTLAVGSIKTGTIESIWQNERCDVRAKKGAKGYRIEEPADIGEGADPGEGELVFRYDSDDGV